MVRFIAQFVLNRLVLRGLVLIICFKIASLVATFGYFLHLIELFLLNYFFTDFYTIRNTHSFQ